MASSIFVHYSRILQVVIHITDHSGFEIWMKFSLIFDPAFGDSSTSCSKEDSSSDDSDSEYGLCDPDVGMHQYSSDSEDGCSEMDDQGTLSYTTSKPSAAHSTTLEDVKVQKPGVTQGQGRGCGRGRGRGHGQGQGERYGEAGEQVGSTSSRGRGNGRKQAARAAIEDSELLDVFDLSCEDKNVPPSVGFLKGGL